MKTLALLVALAACGTSNTPAPDALPSIKYACTASLTCDGFLYQDRVTLCGTRSEVDAWLGDWLSSCFFLAEISGCWRFDCRDECVPVARGGECHNEESTLDAGVDGGGP